MGEPQDKLLGPGSMVGGYRIERRLGQGGAGTVYAAEEPVIKKRVAIKVLRHALAEDEGMALRFEREARAVNEIRHPGIVDVFAIGRLPDGRPYLVMSLLEGCSLRDEIQRRGRACPWPRRGASPGRSPRRSPPPTPRASCTAISSPTTSSWRARAGPKAKRGLPACASSTSASPRSTPRAPTP